MTESTRSHPAPLPPARHVSLVALSLLLFPLWGCGGADQGAEARVAGADRAEVPVERSRPPQGRAWVIFGADTVVAEVADTPQLRERGLMYRTELADGHGMLFVYTSEAPRSFWMQNTYIPLDIGFLDARQVIVDIQQMEPESEELHTSARPAMFALEVPQGWFASRGIEVGAEGRIIFPRR
jgi:uncharacterized protein